MSARLETRLIQRIIVKPQTARIYSNHRFFINLSVFMPLSGRLQAGPCPTLPLFHHGGVAAFCFAVESANHRPHFWSPPKYLRVTRPNQPKPDPNSRRQKSYPRQCLSPCTAPTPVWCSAGSPSVTTVFARVRASRNPLSCLSPENSSPAPASGRPHY